MLTILRAIRRNTSLPLLLLSSALCLFIVLLFVTLSVYIDHPPVLTTYTPLLFQMYIPSVNFFLAQDVFRIGETLQPNADLGSAATITYRTFLETTDPTKIDVILTLNATARRDVDGDYLYDNYDIQPGILVVIYKNDTPFNAQIYRVNSTSYQEQRLLTFFPQKTSLPCIPIQKGVALLNRQYERIGTLLTVQYPRYNITPSCLYNGTSFLANVTIDWYDDKPYINELPLKNGQVITFFTNEASFTATIKK